MSEIEIYTSIDELPLDKYTGNDMDGRVGINPDPGPEDIVVASAIALASPPTTVAAAPAKYVPFVRPLKRNMNGRDVFAVKRALSVAGFGAWGKWNAKQHFGLTMEGNLKKFQKSVKLPANGQYDENTHKRLAPFLDDYGKWLLGQTVFLSPKEKKIQSIVATCMLGYNKRQYIHYTQGWLRMEGVRKKLRPPQYPAWEDCSSFATWAYWVAGAPDPNGRGYDGQGYTGTLITHGTSVSALQIKPGDLVFYGNPIGHVAIAVTDTRVVSHGSEDGPLLLPATYRAITAIRRYV